MGRNVQIPAAFSVQVFLLCVLLVFWAGAEGTGDARSQQKKPILWLCSLVK